VHNIGQRPRSLRAAAAVLEAHRRAPFDVLYAVWADAGIGGALVGLLARRPLLLHLTGGDLVALPDIGYGLLLSPRGRVRLRAALAGAARVLVTSTPIQDCARSLGVRTERVPFGVALDRWPALPPRARNGAHPVRLLHIGSLNAVKDQTTLLRALELLALDGVDFTIDVVGEDTLDGALHRAVQKVMFAPRVIFHGFLPHAELRPIVERSHVLLVSSRHETGPLVVLEAAVAGVPTVGTAVGHIAEWAPHAALAVPVGDHRALAAETLALLRDEERRLRLATAAQAQALAEDADWTAARIVEHLEEIRGA
jgi:glycosyltransferase involved in cell wall biosynthesis